MFHLRLISYATKGFHYCSQETNVTVSICVCILGLLKNSGITATPLPDQKRVYLLTTATPPYCGICHSETACINTLIYVLIILKQSFILTHPVVYFLNTYQQLQIKAVILNFLFYK